MGSMTMNGQTEQLGRLGRFQPALSRTVKRLSGGEQTVRAIDIPSFVHGHVAWDDLKTVNPSGNIRSYTVGDGDLIISLRRPFQVAYVSHPPLVAVAVGPVAVFRADRNQVTPEYVAWLLGQSSIARRVERSAKGTTLVFYPLKELRALTVPVASMQTQRRVAKVWQLQQRILKLERQRLMAIQSLYTAQGNRFMATITDFNSHHGTH